MEAEKSAADLAQDLENLYEEYMEKSASSTNGQGFMSLLGGWLGSGSQNMMAHDEKFVEGVRTLVDLIVRELEDMEDSAEQHRIAAQALTTMTRARSVNQSALLYMEAVLSCGCALVAYVAPDTRADIAHCMEQAESPRRFLPSKKELYAALTNG